MSMVSIKQLANGQLAATIGDLYTVTSGATALVKSVSLVNTYTSTQTVNLYVLVSGGTDRRIIPVDTALSAGCLLVADDNYTLGSGDKIRGYAITAARIDYVISGVEEA